MTKEILESVGTVIAVAGAYLIKELAKYAMSKYKEWLKPLRMLTRNSIDIQIKKILTEIGGYLGASRCYLLSYHNSIKSHTGICHDFVSMVNEYNRHDLPPMMKEFQQIPTGLFLDLIDNINKNGFVKVPQDEESNIGGFHRAFNFGDTYKARVGKTVANGTISVVFDDVRELDHDEIQFIKDRLILINTLLNKKK